MNKHVGLSWHVVLGKEIGPIPIDDLQIRFLLWMDVEQAPPWIHTMTDLFPAVLSAAFHTFRYRQASS